MTGFRRAPLLLLGLTGLCFSQPSIANENEDWKSPIEELFKTELVFTQSQGELQLATAPTYRDGPEGTAFVLPVGIEYGITDSLQLEAEWGAYVDADATDEDMSGSGQGNLSLGLLHSWTDIAKSGLHFAAGLEYEFASGDEKFLDGGNRKDSQELYLIFAKDLEDDSESQLFLQVGVELQQDGRRPMSIILADSDQGDDTEAGDDDDSAPHDPNVWFANVGGYMTWKEAVLSLELNLSEEEEDRFATPGISYRPMNDVEIGLGIAVGLTEEADDYQIIGKLVWELGD